MLGAHHEREQGGSNRRDVDDGDAQGLIGGRMYRSLDGTSAVLVSVFSSRGGSMAR
jgi:hypothetical protein